MVPYNVLFWHYFIDRDSEQSKRIWNNHLKSDSGFYYGPILAVARERFDMNLVLDLIKLLKSSDVHRGMLAGPYSSLLEIYLDRGQIDKALTTLELAEKDCLLESLNKNTLHRVKRVAALHGKPFPYDKLLYNPNQS